MLPWPAHAGELPPVGVNLEQVADWVRLMPFVDLMKGSRAWGSARKPWVHDVSVDAQGWPTEDAGVIVRSGGADKGDPHASATKYLRPGVYRLSFTGRALVRPVFPRSVTVRNLAYDASTDRTTGEIVIGASATSLMLSFQNTAGGVRDVKLLQPGYSAGQTFTDEFLRAIAPFGTLRLTAFLSTHGNPVVKWSERTTPAAATQSGPQGVAWEYAVQLANEARKDIWISVPARADDDYVRQLAGFLHARLDPERVVYVEFSSDLWNPRNPQARENILAAVREALAGDVSLTGGRGCSVQEFGAVPACDSFRAGQFRVGKRLASIHAAFASVYGRRALSQRVRLVLSMPFDDPGLGEAVLKNIATYRGSPQSMLFGVAVAPFYSVDADLLAAPAVTATDLLASLDDSLRHEVLPRFSGGGSAKAIADRYGLQTLAFAGGPDVLAGGEHLAAKFDASMDPRSGVLVRQMLSRWYACGNGLFVYYNLSGGYGTQGAWGLTNHPDDLSAPKYAALADVARTPLSQDAMAPSGHCRGAVDP